MSSSSASQPPANANVEAYDALKREFEAELKEFDTLPSAEHMAEAAMLEHHTRVNEEYIKFMKLLQDAIKHTGNWGNRSFSKKIVINYDYFNTSDQRFIDIKNKLPGYTFTVPAQGNRECIWVRTR
jgi:hypothetical protein